MSFSHIQSGGAGGQEPPAGATAQEESGGRLEQQRHRPGPILGRKFTWEIESVSVSFQVQINDVIAHSAIKIVLKRAEIVQLSGSADLNTV